MDRLDEFEAEVERLVEEKYAGISYEDISESLRFLSKLYEQKYNRNRENYG